MKKEINAFIQQGSVEGWSQSTAEVYRRRLKDLPAFLRRLGRRRVTDVKPEDLDLFMNELAGRGLKKETRRGIASTVTSLFTWLAENGKILSNPARDIAVPDDGERDLPVPPLEDHEVAELFDAVPKRHVVDLRNRLHLELLYGCGLRLSESVSLNVRDCDLTSRTVHVANGKGSKARLLPMTNGIRGALRDYLALRRSLLRGPDHGALLLSNRGTRISDITFRDWLKRFNRRRPNARHVYPHLFRHSVACHLLRNGMDIRHIQAFLGHERLDTTKIYLLLVPGRLKEDYDRSMPTIAVMP